MNNTVFNELIEFGKLEKVATDNYLLVVFINANSKVFLGHFPDKPIMPGVIMIEIIKRASELVVNTKVEMVSASNFKFLKIVNPTEHKKGMLHFSVSEINDSWKVKAQLKVKNEIYFKADVIYKSSK